jgi:hypothetical protein
MNANTLSPEAQDAVKDALLRNLETIIRDFAGNVRSLVQSRQHHPSYGITKLQITKALAQMDGVIGTYRVLAGQTNHPFLALGAEFLDDSTTDAVHEARGRAIAAGIK